MKYTRVIPVLLIDDGALVKSVKFRNHKYIGDPINAVKIFNEKRVDEICILDISASKNGRSPDMELLKDLASEAFMPLSYGGGISSLEEIKDILYNGAEKVVLQRAVFDKPDLITQASRQFGSQSIVVCIDYDFDLFGRIKVVYQNGRKKVRVSINDLIKKLVAFGAGEIILQSVNKDGTLDGYDLKVISEVSKECEVPVIALGGAGSLENMKQAVDSGASAVAAGSYFIYQMPHKAVLISYPDSDQLIEAGLIYS